MKIYVTLAQAKFLLSVFNLLSDKYRQISRKDIINASGIDESRASRIIQDRYLLENRINEINQNLKNKGVKQDVKT